MLNSILFIFHSTPNSKNALRCWNPMSPERSRGPLASERLMYQASKSGQLPKLSEGISQTKKLDVWFLDGLISFISAFFNRNSLIPFYLVLLVNHPHQTSLCWIDLSNFGLHLIALFLRIRKPAPRRHCFPHSHIVCPQSVGIRALAHHRTVPQFCFTYIVIVRLMRIFSQAQTPLRNVNRLKKNI